MQRYHLKAVLQWVATCNHLGCVPLEYLAKFRALVDQANSAEASERRAERAESALIRVDTENVVMRGALRELGGKDAQMRP